MRREVKERSDVQSQEESAGSLYIQTQERSDVVEEEIQSQATVHQQMIFEDSDNSADALSIDNQSQEFDLTSWTTSRKHLNPPAGHPDASNVHPVASYSGSSRELQCYCISSRLGIQTQEKVEVAKRSS
ncbi:hypothetical protein F511_44165 [Dorcoceras hygrometricum]|uniref:Uncharacterized protein n=1 Tax=Dorcoceras hygrometricum TaxID=472368 RepID=A0A2Z7AWJ0_9LAMI|nr:hypothetical protein F511_44165 [Dorcoceras hygrometricum]